MARVLTMDARNLADVIPAESVQTCVTSPPYYKLRDYGVDGQIGLEETIEEYINNLLLVFRQVWQVLRPDGTLWLNLGDSYNGSGGAGGDYSPGGLKEGQPKYPGRKIDSLKPKDLIGIPWRVAFALQADGWYLRSDIIWHKPNPMPESVTDRPTRAHEYVFLLSKSSRYYYDSDAIRKQYSETSLGRYRYAFNPSVPSSQITKNPAIGAGNITPNPVGANKRSVWTIATQPYPEAHFATFPEKLVMPCVLAGTSPQVCPVCGTPWKRVSQPTGVKQKRETAHVPGNTTTKTDSTGWVPASIATNTFAPTCNCNDNDGSGKCIVLDPFAGSGTTLRVAEKLGRQAIGVELNLNYCKLIEKRLANNQLQLIV